VNHFSDDNDHHKPLAQQQANLGGGGEDQDLLSLNEDIIFYIFGRGMFMIFQMQFQEQSLQTLQLIIPNQDLRNQIIININNQDVIYEYICKKNSEYDLLKYLYNNDIPQDIRLFYS